MAKIAPQCWNFCEDKYVYKYPLKKARSLKIGNCVLYIMFY